MSQRDVDALLRFINERRTVPYAWGRSANDCVSFVLEAVKAQTGEDRAAEITWKDEKSGLRAIKKLGGLEAGFDRYFQRIAPAMAHRGDIAGVPDPDLGLKVMLVEGEMLVSPCDTGNYRVPRNHMVAAWSATLLAPKR